MPDPERVPSVPPTETISTSLKVEEASLSVKVRVAVSPIFKVVLSEEIVMVGETVSMLIESWLAAVLLLPTASVKVLAATLIVAVAVVFAVGVKVAV